MSRFTFLAIDHTREYVHYDDPMKRALNDRKRNGTVRANREERCEHGFLCDKDPGPNSVWLCPHCRRTWKPRSHGRSSNNGASRIVAEALKKEPKTKAELYAIIGERLTCHQIGNALHSLMRSGRQLPAEIWKPKRRRDGLPDESRTQ